MRAGARSLTTFSANVPPAVPQTHCHVQTPAARLPLGSVSHLPARAKQNASQRHLPNRSTPPALAG